MSDNNKTMLSKIIELAQTVALTVIMPWAVWTTVNVFELRAKGAMHDQWMSNRPEFITDIQAQKLLLESRMSIEKDVRDELKSITKLLVDLDRKLSEHMSKEIK